MACAPNHYAAWNNLGNILRKMEKTDEALQCFQRVIEIKPDIAEVHNNIAGIWKIKGENEKAEEGYREAIRLNPGFDKAHMNLGNIYLDEKKTGLAEKHLRQAVSLNGQNQEAYISLANLMQQQGMVEEMIPLLRAAIKINPDLAGPYIALGSSYQTRGDSGNAEKCYRKAIELEPDSALASMNFGILLESTGKMTEALESFKRAVELKPDFSTKVFLQAFQLEMKLGIWDEYDVKLAELMGRLEAYVTDDDQKFDLPLLALNYFPLPEELHHTLALKIAGKVKDSMVDIKKRCNFSYGDNSAGRLKIGYVSPDFRQHAVGILISEMFRFHDRERFEVFAYSLIDVEDKISANIKSFVDSFVDISKMSPEEAARKIHEDHIDIVIDMAGYTTYSCPSIFALEPAPVQAQFLGYPDTTGADYIHYLLVDPQIMDEGLEPFYSEKIVYLPQSFISSPMEISKKSKSRKDYGLPEDAFIFCCSNSSYKVEPNTFKVWMEILKETPHSFLWLLYESDDYCSRIRNEAKMRGVDSERIFFAANEAIPNYLARIGLADLFLDTFIYSAGATAVCSVYAGLPILTLKGHSYTSRLGTSVLAASGLSHMICRTEKEYKARAIELAKRPEDLMVVRNMLSEKRDTLPIFDTAAFVKNMEKGFSKMWESHLKEEPPENIVVEADQLG